MILGKSVEMALLNDLLICTDGLVELADCEDSFFESLLLMLVIAIYTF